MKEKETEEITDAPEFTLTTEDDIRDIIDEFHLDIPEDDTLFHGYDTW